MGLLDGLRGMWRNKNTRFWLLAGVLGGGFLFCTVGAVLLVLIYLVA